MFMSEREVVLQHCRAFDLGNLDRFIKCLWTLGEIVLPGKCEIKASSQVSSC